MAFPGTKAAYEGARAPLSLGTLEFRVRGEDWKGIFTASLAILAVALPIGYATGFLVAPRAPQLSGGLVGAVVDIAQIVLFEEILFRAFLFGALHNRLGIMPAAIASAAVFGLLHLIQFPYPMALMAGWAGLVLALQYERTRRISVPMITHALLIVVQFFVLP